MRVDSVQDRLRALGAWLRSADGLAYLALLAVALAVRLFFAPLEMVSSDMAAFEYWGQLANQHFFHVYTQGALTSSWIDLPNYSPVAIYLYGILDKVSFGLAAWLGIPLAHTVSHSHALKLAFKLPGITADLTLLTILYVKALGVTRRRVAWLLSATYALSPGILFTVVFWGQVDGIMLLLIVSGLLFAMRKQAVWCGMVLALAVNFKPQPIVFVPLALIALWRWGSFRLVVRGALAFIAVTVVVWIPYALPPFGELSALAHNIAAAETAEGLTASHSGWNLWFALGRSGQSAAMPLLGSLTLSLVGYALFALVMLIAVLGVWRDARPVQLWAGAGLIALAFFTLGTLQFERYLFPALGLFFLAALYDKRYWLLYATLSVTFMANFEWTLYACDCEPITSSLPPAVQQALLLHLDPWQGGVINCGALVVGLVFFLWPRKARAAERQSFVSSTFGPSMLGPSIDGPSMLGAAQSPLPAGVALAPLASMAPKILARMTRGQ